VLYPVPSFVVYRIAALAHRVEVVEVPLDARMQLDEAAVGRAFAERRPHVAFFALPNNPTGTLWSVDAVLGWAKAHPETIVVSDEAYIEYGGRTAIPELASLPNLVVMRTVSKIGMAGLRVGFLSAHPALVAELEKVRPPYNLGQLNQQAATWLLRHHAGTLRALCREVVRERERLLPALRALAAQVGDRLPIEVFDSQANLVLVRFGQPGDGRATAIWRSLMERGILVRNFDRPGHGGPLAGCLRITVGTPAENEMLLAALTEVVG
jgi:histidinol-phosphate aminotransferase